MVDNRDVATKHKKYRRLVSNQGRLFATVAITFSCCSSTFGADKSFIAGQILSKTLDKTEKLGGVGSNL